jgi:N-acetylglucosamine kinase-like BadF-type ATPase
MQPNGSKYIAGVDIGGTFTDCVVLEETGRITIGKALSTPDDFAQGAIDARVARVSARVARVRLLRLDFLCHRKHSRRFINNVPDTNPTRNRRSRSIDIE